MRRLVYDCEISRLIPISETEQISGYQYCNGWTDFENMGIAVIGICDIDSEELVAYTENGILGTRPINDLVGLLGEFYYQIWGLNSRRFDDKLMMANDLYDLQTDHDLLDLIRLSAFGSTSWRDTPKSYRYDLGAIAQANGMAKSGSGELAPKLWQDGKHQEVIDYCLNDCLVTARLIKLIERGELIDPNTGKKLSICQSQKIKVLTLKQPWAWAVFNMGKDIENRYWTDDYRGKLYIHAGKSYDEAGAAWIEQQFNVKIPNNLEMGCILGSVELVDINRDSFNSPWAMKGQWHWKLENPVALKNSIPARGNQKIWEFETVAAKL